MSRRLTGVDLLDEVQWLLDGGMHPLMVCPVLGKSLSAVAATAVRLGDVEIARLFSTVRKQERDRQQRRVA